MKKRKTDMLRYAPTLGLISGTALGMVAALLSQMNLVLFMGVGAAVGLVIGSIVLSFSKE